MSCYASIFWDSLKKVDVTKYTNTTMPASIQHICCLHTYTFVCVHVDLAELKTSHICCKMTIQAVVVKDRPKNRLNGGRCVCSGSWPFRSSTKCPLKVDFSTTSVALRIYDD
ncbi:hypothetical protein AGIG_G2119 [Arapaima gigas]